MTPTPVMGDIAVLPGQGLAELLERELQRDPRLKSAHTRRGYQADLLVFDAWRASRPATKLLVEQYAAELQLAGKAPNTINRILAALRWYARRLADLIQEETVSTETEERQRAERIAQAHRMANVTDVRGIRLPKGREITQGELAALMAACENDLTPAGSRDAALIAVAWSAGLRRDELAGLSTGDFKPTDGLEGDLLVQGKGDKERTVYLYNGAFSALTDWLQLRGQVPGPLFCAINKGHKIKHDQHLSGEALRLVLESRISEARLNPLTWHDFRRTFAGNLLDNGQDLATVQRLMGHSDPATTSSYDRRGEGVRRNAIKTLHVPYRGRLL